MPIIAFDPARVAGYAIARHTGEIIGAGEFRIDQLGLAPVRALLDAWRHEEPLLCAVESAWMGKNAHAALAVAMMAGRFVEAAESRGYVVHIVKPAQWRVAAGIPTFGRFAKRAEAKSAAIKIARMKCPGMVIATDNAAESILLAFYAAGMVRMGQWTCTSGVRRRRDSGRGSPRLTGTRAGRGRAGQTKTATGDLPVS